MKKLILFLFLCNFYMCFSQNFSGMMSIQLDKKCKSYASVDKNQSNTVLYFIDSNKNEAILIDGNTTFVDSLRAKPIDDYDKIVTEHTLNKVSKIVFANQRFTSFCIQKFDFNNRKITSNIFSFNINGRNLLQVFFNNDKLYILSCSIFDKSLILTSVSDDEIVSDDVVKVENVDKKIFETLSDYTYSAEKNKFPIVIIEENKYSTFSETQSLSKGYIKNNTFVICLETNKNETRIFSINTQDKTATTGFVKKDISEKTTSCNTIVIGNNIYQVIQNKDNFTIQIKDFQGNVLKKLSEYNLYKSKFFTEAELGEITEIESKTYFKKVNNQEIGINYKKKNDKLYLNIGTVTNARIPIDGDQKVSYTQYGLLTGGLIGGLIGAIIDSAKKSPNINSNSELITNGQTFCQIVLDENFNVLETSKNDFSHNKLKKQIINSNSFTIPSIFYMNEAYYLGYYIEKEKRYFFKKFKDE